MSDWWEGLPGIKDLIDATGETPLEMPRYSKIQVEGAAQVIPDTVNEVLRIVVVGQSGGLALTPIQDADYSASYGQHVVLGSGDPMPSLLLPAASGQVNGRVGVTATASGGNPISAQGEDDIHGAGPSFTIDASQTLIFQSDGVSKWWIVGSYLPL